MKGNFWKKLLTFMSCIVATLGLMCFVSCAADAGSDSDDNNTDKLVLDFNGGTMHGHKTVEFTMEDITPHVGKAIDEAFKCLGLDTAYIKKEGFYLHGWTLKKNGETCVTNLPTFGTLYAKWGTDPLPKDEDVPLTLTLDFNGGKLDGASFKYFDNSKVAKYADKTIDEALEGLGITTITKENYELVGWTDNLTTANEVTTLPTKGNVTLYAIWQFNGTANPLTLTLDFNGGTSGEESYFVLTDDLVADYKGMLIATYFTEKNKPLPTKEGYTLIGWSTTRNGEATIVNIPLEGTVKYYAVWEEKDEPYPDEPSDPVVPEKLTFTYDAGKGYFHDFEKDELLKTISVEFDPGATLSEISELLMNEHMDHINPMYFFKKDNIEYSYEENGKYYYLTEIKNSDGEVICNYITNYINQDAYTTKFYDDITFYYSYAKMTNITFKLNGGYVEQYDHETDEENIVTTDIFGFGLEGYKAFSVNDPERDGYVFMGWTLTKDGNDFVTVVPSEDTTLYAKWELPKECVLTINAGEYSQLFDRDGNSLGREVNLTFTSGMTLEGVLSNNNIDFDCMVNEFEIPDTTFEGLKDSEGNEYSYNIANHISDKKLVDSITLYPFYQRIEISGNVGILKYYDYVNDYGNYDEKAEPKYEKKYDKDIFEDCLNTPHADGYIFAGWTYTPNGNDYVNLDDYIPAGVTTTVYAKWIPESEVKPLYEYSSDNSQITFTFVPSYFGYDWDSDEFHEVQLMSEAVGWDPSEKRLMEKDSDGNYTVTVPYNAAAYKLYEKWSGFKFYVFEDEAYLGPTQCKISSYDVINMGDPNFKLQLATSNLTIDLNGGNIDGDTSSLEYEVDEYIGTSMNGFIEGFKDLSLPVKDDYVFAGWTLTENGDDYVDYVPGGVNTIYAKWIIPSTQTITLIAREGDNFYNWNDEPLGNEVSFEFEVGITLNELLSQNNIDYSTMIKNYESDIQSYRFQNLIDGDGNIYDPSKILADSVVLHVQYSVQAKITFDLNGGQFEAGEENQTIYVTYDDPYYPYYLDWYEKPTKEGYKFIGWTSTKDGNDFINDITGPIPNGIVYAKWQDPLKLFDNGDLVGDFSVVKAELKDGTIEWVYDDTHGLNLTYEGEGVYSTTFTYHDYMCGWDQDTDYCDFKIRAVAGSWQGASYGVAGNLDQPELDGDEVLCGSNNAPNVRIPAEEGVTYKVTFRCTSDGNVYVKIATVK